MARIIRHHKSDDREGKMRVEDKDERLAALARKMRSAVDLNQGVIDIRACLEVAALLEAMVERLPGIEGRYLAETYPAQIAKISDSDALAAEGIPTLAEELKHIFAFRSSRESHCLRMFLADPGELFLHAEIARRIRCTPNAVKVYISHMRKSLIGVGIDKPIINVYGKGYYMPVGAGRRIGRLIRDYRGSVPPV